MRRIFVEFRAVEFLRNLIRKHPKPRELPDDADSETEATPATEGTNPLKGGSAPDVVDADAKLAMKEAMALYGARGEAAWETYEEDEQTRIADETPIVRLSNTIIQQALKASASDLHLEPDARAFRVRYRIDGVLHEAMAMPKYIQLPLTARFKIMAEMKPSVQYAPQDGQIGVRYDNRNYHLRVSCLRTLYGEKTTVHIQEDTAKQLALNKLGFRPETQGQLEELLYSPSGLLLVVGPRGCGKTRTLHSLLNRRNTDEVNVLSFAEQHERRIPGITQTGLNRREGITFASILPSVLQENADILHIDALNDVETMQAALTAAEAGHLVLSEMDTLTAPMTLMRMLEEGAKPYQLGTNVIGVLAQRLVRKVCTNCKEFYGEEASALRRFGYRMDEPMQKFTLARGKGCEMCRHTGYKGRIGLFELLRMNAELREMLVQPSPRKDLKEAALANGTHELRADGLVKILDGVTTPDEVMRVCPRADWF